MNPAMRKYETKHIRRFVLVNDLGDPVAEGVLFPNQLVTMVWLDNPTYNVQFRTRGEMRDVTSERGHEARVRWIDPRTDNPLKEYP